MKIGKKKSKPTSKVKKGTKSAFKAAKKDRPSYVDKLAGDRPSWMVSRDDEVKAFQDRKQAEQQSNRRAPEFWLSDGDSKTVRVVQFLAAVERYSVRVGGKWKQVTAPGVGEVDLFRSSGLVSSERYIYEIVDIDGYVDKKTKKAVTELRRFWVVSRKVHDQLQTIESKRGDLDGYNIDVSRIGTGQQTTYQLMPDVPSRFKKSWEAQDELGEDGVIEYYSPPDEDAQRQLLNIADTDDD